MVDNIGTLFATIREILSKVNDVSLINSDNSSDDNAQEDNLNYDNIE